MTNVEKNLKLFNKNFIGKIYPSLLSKYISYEIKYWKMRFYILKFSNFNKPIKIFRLSFSYLKILLVYVFVY